MARSERRFDTAPARYPSTGHGSGAVVSDAAGDTAEDPDDPADAPRTRQWTLDRIERIIGSIA